MRHRSSPFLTGRRLGRSHAATASCVRPLLREWRNVYRTVRGKYTTTPAKGNRKSTNPTSGRVVARARAAVAQGDFEAAFAALGPGLAQPPFSPAVRDVVVDQVNRIFAIEVARGEIPRAARSALAPAAQPLQDFIDRLLYAMASLTEEEVRGLEERLAYML